MTGRDKQIDDMLDREAIRDLPVRYCHFVRQKNVKAVLDLFSENAVFDVAVGADDFIADGAHTGKATIEKVFSTGLDKIDPWPFVHNHVIDLQGNDRAKGWVYAEIRIGTEKMRAAQIVVYEDDYVKENGRWKFHKRALTLTPIPV
jgi:hypothetical protein